MRKVMTVISLVLAAACVLIGAMPPAGASTAPANTGTVATGAAAKALCNPAQSPTNCPSWNAWKCSATSSGSRGDYKYGWRCYTWVRYDYCGGGRNITTAQYTKMRTQFVYADFAQRFQTFYEWKSRGSSGAVTHTYQHNGSSYHYVFTTVKPDNMPYVTCTL